VQPTIGVTQGLFRVIAGQQRSDHVGAATHGLNSSSITTEHGVGRRKAEPTGQGAEQNLIKRYASGVKGFNDTYRSNRPGKPFVH
jgi:hypothetical protein